MRLESLLLLIGMAVGTTSHAEPSAERLCGGELPAMMEIMMADRAQAQKDRMLEPVRRNAISQLGVDAVASESASPLVDAIKLPAEEYLAFARGYLEGLEAKVNWAAEKSRLVVLMHKTIESLDGDFETKVGLKDLIEENSIVSLTSYLDWVAEQDSTELRSHQEFLAQACGPDALGQGAIAFPHAGRRVFAFCPGALLRASIETTEQGMKWSTSLNADQLAFTAAHEFGHILGANRSSEWWSLYADLLSCLNTHGVMFAPSQSAEVVADYWGAWLLVNVLTERESHPITDPAAWVAQNLAPFSRGSILSPDHLPFGARSKMILDEVCPLLQAPAAPRHRCSLVLSRK